MKLDVAQNQEIYNRINWHKTRVCFALILTGIKKCKKTETDIEGEEDSEICTSAKRFNNREKSSVIHRH